MKYLVIISTLFVIGSLAGYIIELFFRRFVSQKKWVNPGFLVGPYIPLYGFGVLILYGVSNIDLVSLLNVSELWANVIMVVAIGLGTTLIELIAGLIFIKGLHLKLWDYSDRWGNFKGVICPLFSAIWMAVGCAYYFLVNPYLVQFIEFISENLIYTYFVGAVVGMMFVDFCYSLNLGIKIKRAAGVLTVKFEDFKVHLKEDIKEKSGKNKFYGTLIGIAKANDTLQEIIKDHVSKIKPPHKWWKKTK